MRLLNGQVQEGLVSGVALSLMMANHFEKGR